MILRTGTPAMRAASRLPPTAITYRPYRVRFNTIQPRIAIVRNTNTETGIPKIRPTPNQSRDPGRGSPNEPPFRSRRPTGSLSFNRSATPLAIENMASVAMNGTTRP
jgi:hypothetical protein